MIQTTTLETVILSNEFAGIITGRSSFARLGIMVHCCQEFINPGHGQSIPLQIINMAPCPVELDLRVPICQLVLFKLATPASGEYKTAGRSKYADEDDPLPSQIHVETPNQDEGKSEPDQKKHSAMHKLRVFLSRYILPFLPSLIMILIITPFVQNNITDRTISELVDIILDMPSPIVLGGALICIYIWIKRGEKK